MVVRECTVEVVFVTRDNKNAFYFLLKYVTQTFLRFINLKFKFYFWGLCPRIPLGILIHRLPEVWTLPPPQKPSYAPVFTCMNARAATVHCGSKNAPTLADYNYDPVQSILIIFSKLFVNDHKSGMVVKFSTSPHICCHYTL